MKIQKLYVKNIGPFQEATLEFPTEQNLEAGEQPVTIITGVNGAGKSIVIDAIRAALGGQQLERNIVAKEDDFKIELTLNYDGTFKTKETHTMYDGVIQTADWNSFGQFFSQGYKQPDKIYDWVVDYWSFKLPMDSFNLNTMKSIDNNRVLQNALQGK